MPRYMLCDFLSMYGSYLILCRMRLYNDYLLLIVIYFVDIDKDW